ncbi:unnamed protein product [Blepharisma stoltei]|uniref:Smr domain-containing protein n=1 Tax=Blepharisma stoltei TaxID=1481888 RepID=A0AAU9K7F3_9CILI|nr:unnamed protein product [Blepharisma stoltei]
MKYGNYGKMPGKIDLACIKQKKPSAKQKRELSQLREIFSNLSIEQIESTYNDQKCNFESTLEILQTVQSPQEQAMDFLQGMFGQNSAEMIQEVYQSCEENIEKTTAFLIEANKEMLVEGNKEEEAPEEENEFGNSAIGYVNSQALRRRLDAEGLEMIYGIFPNMAREVINKTFYGNNGNFYETVRILNESYPNSHIPEERKNSPSSKSAKPKDQAFPSLCTLPKSKTPQGVWSQFSNNHFLDGNNLDAVRKLNLVLKCFPAVDEELIKETFFQCGDDYKETVATLKILFPDNYRDPPPDTGVIRITQQSSPSRISRGDTENVRIVYGERMRDEEYNEKIEAVNRYRKLQEAYFQGAGKAASVGNWNEAKRLSSEGKKYQDAFEKVYNETYMETFRRINNRPGVIDLHGLRVKEAIELLEAFLHESQEDGLKRVEVVTGKGMHSTHGIAKIKPAVAEYLKEKGYKASDLEGGYSVSLS